MQYPNHTAPTIRRMPVVNKLCSVTGSILFLFTAVLRSMPYEEMVPGFNRVKSHVFVRKISCPTAANLDFAAYDRNPMLYDPPQRKPAKKPAAAAAEGLTFSGALINPVMSLGATPLSEQEKKQPLAWKPFMKRAWEVVKDEELRHVAGKINSYKWADTLVFQPYQEVTAAYIHYGKGRVELWVKVEFAPWVDFLKEISDEDNDGCREIYGRLNTGRMNPDSLSKIIAWVKDEYTFKTLSAQEMADWATDLASYWYPTRNTDVLDLSADGRWPDARTSKKALRELAGITVRRPLAVIEGKPLSPNKPVYNVFLVDTPPVQNAAPRNKAGLEKAESPATLLDVVFSVNFRRNSRVFAEEISRYGPYKKWEEANALFFNAVRSWLLRFPAEQTGLEGKDGWIFFRKSIDYMLGGDLSLQPERTNPLPHIIEMKNFCAEAGIELLFAAVPNKEEVYYDRMSDSIPPPAIPLVNPYGRKFLADLQHAGVEVIDLLPAFIEAKSGDSLAGVPVYQQQDTHWSGRGLEIAAGLIAERIKAYGWYRQYRDTVSYTITDTVISRPGDLTEQIPQDRQAIYSPGLLPLRRVFNPDGKPYEGNHVAAPILLIGDSFTGVFELIDCKSAGVGSHIAYRTRIPVDIITSWGGGPMVRQKMVRLRGKYLNLKRVVVYLMVARDLYNYSQGWDPLKSPDP